MRRIFKYPLDIVGIQLVSMPVGAELLTVQMQQGVPCLWALVEDSAPKEDRVIYFRGTGHEAPDFKKDEHIATFQERAFVWHVFDGGAEITRVLS